MPPRRLYLDTGDLLPIADGLVAKEVVDDLLDAMVASDTRLVLSRSHMQDALSNVDGPTKERFIAAIERFQPVPLLVLDGPYDVEPHAPDRAVDIVVQACGNFREIVTSDLAAPWLATESETQTDVHIGDVAAQVAILTSPVERQKGPLRKECIDLAIQCAITIVRGWRGDDAVSVLEFWREEKGIDLTDAERGVILRELEAVAAQMGPLRLAIERAGIDVTEALRRVGSMTADPARSPGGALVYLVGGARRRDPWRRRLRSDVIDIEHVAHFPYVDVASCDRGMCHAVNAVLHHVRGPRTPRVFRNGQLPAITQHLRSSTP